MPWEIDATDVYDAWFDGQGDDVQDAILAHLKALATEGPRLGRPYCDTLQGSRVKNLKELRVQVGGDPFRVLFAFDSERCAVLLLGGNKRGDKRWYDTHISPRPRCCSTPGKSSAAASVPPAPHRINARDDRDHLNLTDTTEPYRLPRSLAMPKMSYLDRKLTRLPADRRAKVDEMAEQIVEANRLARLREDMGLTQHDMADRLSVKQAAVSQIERRGDIRLSTLRRYVLALGGRLEVRVKIPRRADVVLGVGT